ncbi:MAG TPA: phosphate-starvation-inducible PsiE family protein [Methanomicrobiales archaeon]|nr:phosphate-starvation-inducible PsiE family protein [Methanomicrobiales archaeon]
METHLSFQFMTGILSLVTRWIYLALALVLSFLALISLVDVIRGFIDIGSSPTLTAGILNVLHAVLLTIIIVEILETVIVYFQTNRVLVRPILVAGLTAMVRRILFYGVGVIQPMDLLVDAVVIAVLTAAVVLIGKEESRDIKGS